MEHSYRVLGIAPYEGMKTLMADLAEEYPQMDLTLFVGDLEQGLEIAHSNFHGNYDVVISRGGTAKMLKKNLPLPVVEIPVSMYDLLCTLKLAGVSKGTGTVSMVSFDNITANARLLCDLMDYDLDIHTVDDGADVDAILLGLKNDHCDAILCDAVSNAAAKRLGFHSFLITSGADSIRQAFEQALLLCRSQTRLREENLFFRELLHGQIGQTMVLDDDGHLYLSTQENPPPDLLELLRRELPESKQAGERRIIRNMGGMLYVIRSRRVTSGNLSRTAFFFTVRKSPLSPGQTGIRFSTRPEAEAAFSENIFSFARTTRGALQADIDRISRSKSPVVVTGEDGTGKESVVNLLYMRGSLRNNPLVFVNCSLLSDKSWAFLLEHHNSPLAGADTTLYFASIDALSPERQHQLLAALSEMDVCRRNRVIFSCVCQPGEYLSPTGSLFMDKLCCLSLFLPPLRQLAEQIPALVNLDLSHLNANLPRQLVGAEPEALALLQSFRWPYNYTQFRRVIGELAVAAAGPVITAEDVRHILQKERHMGAFSSMAENASAPLDLNRTLEQISQDVALRVLEETGGNQTAAAKRLGISRTTLWRLLQKQELRQR